MPLSPPAPREHRHTRQIECRGYRREDGLWDIEGHLTDVKSYAFDNAFRGRVEAGVPVHDMWVRLTVDAALKVHAAEAETIAGPYRICPQAAPAVEQLAGLTIGARLAGKSAPANRRHQRVHAYCGDAPAPRHGRVPDRIRRPQEMERRSETMGQERETAPYRQLLRAAFRRRSGARALSDLVHRVRRRQAQNQRLTPRAARLSRRHRAPGREPRARAPDPRARRPIPRRPNVGVRHASSRQTAAAVISTRKWLSPPGRAPA